MELNKYTDYNRNIDYGYIVLMSLFKKNSPNTDYTSPPPLGGGANSRIYCVLANLPQWKINYASLGKSGFAYGRRNEVASPDSEDIECAEPKVLKRDYPSVEQIRDGCRCATGGGKTLNLPTWRCQYKLGRGVKNA